MSTRARIGRPVAVATIAGAAGALLWARRDYRRWQALGEGGILWSLKGWIQVTRLRLKMGSPFDTSAFPVGTGHPGLRDLPVRPGRPRVAPHPVPHRQLDQEASEAMLDELAAVFAAELAARPGGLEERQSQYERHYPALYARALVARGESGTGEVGHFHRPQGSMHMHLNPADARLVIERGWGELHGLSGRSHGLPATYTLIYAPRDRQELDAVRSILAASLDWATEGS
jgi:hypothetical protein